MKYKKENLKKRSKLHAPSSTVSGFAMLFSVLTSSLVLAIGISIFNLTLKELKLSSSGRESQFAFYAADTGAECALYWDFFAFANPLGVAFPTSTSNLPPYGADTPACASNSNIPSNWTVDDTANSATTEFDIEIPESDACAHVTVAKTDPDNDGYSNTEIQSRGYNIDSNPGNGDCDLGSSEILLERALRIKY